MTRIMNNADCCSILQSRRISDIEYEYCCCACSHRSTMYQPHTFDKLVPTGSIVASESRISLFLSLSPATSERRPQAWRDGGAARRERCGQASHFQAHATPGRRAFRGPCCRLLHGADKRKSVTHRSEGLVSQPSSFVPWGR